MVSKSAKPRRFMSLSLYSERTADVAAGIRAQAPQHPAVVTQRVIPLGGFDDLRDPRQRGIAHDAAEGLGADAPFRDPFVAIDPRSRRRARIVEMQALQQLEPYHAIEFLPH